MRRHSNLWTLVVVCAVAAGCGKDTDKDKAKKLDTSYIPAEAVAVVVAHPSEILEAEMIKDSPISERLDEIEENTGIKVADVAQVVVPIFADPKNEPGVIIRTHKPYDKDKVGGRQFSKERRKELEHEGKKYFKSGREALCFADDTTMIVGEESAVKRLIAAEKADSALIKKLKDAEHHHFLVMAEVGDAKTLLKAMGEEAEGTPVSETAKWAEEHVKSVVLWADVSPKIKIHATIESDDEKGGERLNKAVDEAKNMAEGFLKLGKTQIVKSIPDGHGEAVYQLAIDALANLKAEDKGKSFELSFTEPENAKDVFAKLKPTMEKMAAESKKQAMAARARNNLYQIGFALLDYQSKNQKWPTSLDDIKEELGDEYDDVMTNPVTGDTPGYEYVKPTSDDLEKGLSKTVVLYQLRDGKRDESLDVFYATGSVRKIGEEPDFGRFDKEDEDTGGPTDDPDKDAPDGPGIEEPETGAEEGPKLGQPDEGGPGTDPVAPKE